MPIPPRCPDKRMVSMTYTLIIQDVLFPNLFQAFIEKASEDTKNKIGRYYRVKYGKMHLKNTDVFAYLGSTAWPTELCLSKTQTKTRNAITNFFLSKFADQNAKDVGAMITQNTKTATDYYDVRTPPSVHASRSMPAPPCLPQRVPRSDCLWWVQDLVRAWINSNKERIADIKTSRKEDTIGDEIIIPRETEEQWVNETTTNSAVIIFNESPTPSAHEEKSPDDRLAAENVRTHAALDASVQKSRETYEKTPIHVFRVHFAAENIKFAWSATHADMEKVWNGIYANDKASALQHTPAHPGVTPTPARKREHTHTHA